MRQLISYKKTNERNIDCSIASYAKYKNNDFAIKPKGKNNFLGLVLPNRQEKIGKFSLRAQLLVTVCTKDSSG